MKRLCCLLFILPTMALADDFKINDQDLDKVSKADIIATVKHLIVLAKEQETKLHLQSIVLANAMDDVAKLQGQINDLARQAARVPVLEAQVQAAHRAVWRNLFIGLGVGALLGFFGPTLLKLLPLV